MAYVPVYFDDFSPLIVFNGGWTTNNATNGVYSAAGYSGGTYHNVTASGGSFAFNYTGTGFELHGIESAGLQHNITVDGQTTSYSGNATTANSVVTLNSISLPQGSHNVRVDVPANSRFSFDFAVVNVLLGGNGATFTNTSVEDTDSRLQYSGSWTQNTDASFSGGTTHYTSDNGGSVSLRFNGSAVYVFGDRAGTSMTPQDRLTRPTDYNHGPYTVSIDGRVMQSLTGAGVGDYKNTLAAFVSGLDSSEHNVTIRNLWSNPSGPPQYFDLDRFVITQPSVYASASSSNSTSTMSPSGSTASSAPSTSSKQSGASHASVGLLALIVLMFHLCRSVARS